MKFIGEPAQLSMILESTMIDALNNYLTILLSFNYLINMLKNAVT